MSVKNIDPSAKNGTPAQPSRRASTPAMVMKEMRGQVTAGLAVTVLLVGGVGGWAATTHLAGAVIGAGTVVVDSNVKKVQHPTGGIVGEIKVRDGDKVEAGDLVMRLDDTITRANLGIVTSQLDEFAVRQSRLIAERDERPEMAIPESLAGRTQHPDIIQILAGERSLFLSRRKSREGQKSQLNERLNQLKEEVGGLDSQRNSKAKEIELIRRELVENEKLVVLKLTTLAKNIQLNREATRIEGEHGQLTASMAQARARIAETQLQILQLDNDLRTEVTKELREIQGKVSELKERRIAAEDQLRRVDIRAPQSGTVHQLAVHTIGGVISPSEPVMQIVPQDEVLVVEVKVAQQDIAQLRLGQEANVRFTAFDQQSTPELKGTITRMPANVNFEQQQANLLFYVVRVGLTDAEMKKLEGKKLLPGMPAEVYIQTSERTALSYATKPLFDQIARAFKER